MNETATVDPAATKTIRFDGTVTAGNLLTAVVLLVGGVSAYTKLDGRVDHVADLHARLEADVKTTFRDLREAQVAGIARVEKAIGEETQRNREADAEIKQTLRRLDTKLDSVIMSLPPSRPTAR